MNRKTTTNYGLAPAFWFLSAFVFLMTLTACGGGGGGGGGSPSKTWGSPDFVETTDTEDARFPLVAMDGSGNAIAVWSQAYVTSPSTKYHLWANRYDTATGGWGTPIAISTGSEDSYSPSLAVNAAGDAIVAWTSRGTASPRVLARLYSSSTNNWGLTRRISETTDRADINSGPAVAIDPSGNSMVTWSEYYAFSAISTTRWLWGRRLTAGGGLQTAYQIDILGNSGHSKVALAVNGDAVVVFEQHDGTRFNMRASRNLAAFPWLWASSVLLETDDSDARSVSLAMDPAGNATAVWHMSDGSRNNIWASRMNSGTGTWSVAEVIETGSGDAVIPAVGMDDAGNALVVWRQSDGARVNIWSNRFSSGTWGLAELIETNDDDIALLASTRLAVNGAGDAIAVWDQGTPKSIWVNHYSPGSGWGVARTIESEDGNAVYPDVAMNHSGSAVAIWQQTMATRWNIRSNAFR